MVADLIIRIDSGDAIIEKGIPVGVSADIDKVRMEQFFARPVFHRHMGEDDESSIPQFFFDLMV